MRELEDGSKVYIRKNNTGFMVEHVAANGITADVLECDTFGEAEAILNEHPANW